MKKIYTVATFAVACLLTGMLFTLYDTTLGFCTDNEKFYNSLISNAGIGLILSIPAGMLLSNKKILAKANYIMHIVLRYGVAYFFFSYALSQIMDVRFPGVFATLDYKLSDLDPSEFLWAFFGYTYGYQAFIGWMQVLGGALLFFRSTTPLGLILLNAIIINILAMEINYEMCHVTEASIYLSTTLFVSIPYAKNLIKILVLNKGTQSIKYPLLDKSTHGYKALSILKLVIISGILIFYFNRTQRYLKYYRTNAENPYAGVWKVDDVSYKTSDLTNISKVELSKFQNIYLERRRFGAVMADDSISYFEYIIDTTYNQLEFWNFHGFRSLDLKGRYEMQGSDTILYKGVNRKDTIEMRLVLDKKYHKLR